MSMKSALSKNAPKSHPWHRTDHDEVSQSACHEPPALAAAGKGRPTTATILVAQESWHGSVSLNYDLQSRQHICSLIFGYFLSTGCATVGSRGLPGDHPSFTFNLHCTVHPCFGPASFDRRPPQTVCFVLCTSWVASHWRPCYTNLGLTSAAGQVTQRLTGTKAHLHGVRCALILNKELGLGRWTRSRVLTRPMLHTYSKHALRMYL